MNQSRRAPGGRALWATLALGLGSAAPRLARAQQNERYTVFRVGADVGFSRLANENFYQVNATGLLRLGPFRTDFAFPLRFRSSDLAFREQDYAEGRDYLRAVRCARLDFGDYRRPADRYDASCEAWGSQRGLHDRQYLSLRVSPLRDFSLGHNTLVSGFNNSLDPNRPQLGAVADLVVRDIAHAHAVIDDVASPRLMAAQASLRPLQVLGQNWDETPDDLQLDVSVVRDNAAPLRVRTAFGEPLRDGQGNLQSATTALTALSAAAHYLYLWSACTAQSNEACERSTLSGLFAYADYNRFVEVADADGLHAGVHYRYMQRQRYRMVNDQTLPGAGRMFDTWELRVGAEYRNMGNRYLPEYFDGNYGVQSQQFALNDAARRALGPDAQSTTKLEFLLSQPEGRQHGLQAYLRLYIPIPTAAQEPPSRLPITLFVEDASGPLRTSVGATVGPLQIDQLVIAAQYLRRNFEGLDAIFELDGSLFRVLGAMYLTSQAQRRQAPDSLLNNLMLNLSFNRRFLRQDSGNLVSTNDFIVTLGTSTGVN
ncbi:MAG: hypothetical protein JNK72_12905 [Myxococcales bacterium]|nr:hypothetical protein [Myxococcales bacterium]